MPPAHPALPSPDAQAQGDAALKRLAATPDQAVGRGAEKVAGISPEEEAGRKRAHRDRRRENWTKVEGWAIWAAGAISILLAVALAILIIAVLYRWVGFIMKSAEKTDNLVRGAVWTILVAGASSWGTRWFQDRD